jgi:hypothetical protein
MEMWSEYAARTDGGLAGFVHAWLQPLLVEKLDTVKITYDPWEGELLPAPELLAALGRAGPQLESLSLKNIAVSQQLSSLTTLTQLTELHLESCGMHTSEVAQLSVLTQLRCLSLVENPRVWGEAGAFWALAGTLGLLTSLRCHDRMAAAALEAFGDRVEAEWFSESYRDHSHTLILKLPE